MSSAQCFERGYCTNKQSIPQTKQSILQAKNWQEGCKEVRVEKYHQSIPADRRSAAGGRKIEIGMLNLHLLQARVDCIGFVQY